MELEGEAERQRVLERRKLRSPEEAEKRGETLVDLVAVDEQPSLGGRSLATLIKRNRTLALPWNRFKSGSPVVAIFKEEEGLAPCFGVVATKDNHAIQVVFDSPLEAVQLNLEMSVDDVSRNRQWSAMQAVEQSRGRIAQLRDVLLCERDPKWDTSPKLSQEMDASLNDSQRSAVEFAMSAQDLAIIHGPPGTGKTTTLIEIICQAVAKGQRILATAPSNTAVDNLVEKLAERRIEVLRIGHPARVQESLLSHTLDAMADSDPAMEIVRQLRRDAAKCSEKAEKRTRSRPVPGARQDMRREAKLLREDAKHLEKQIIESLLDRAQVLCATTTYDPEILGDRRFDLAIVDEACQSTEPGCWPVVLRAERLILAGDHCQLPPTVLSQEAAREGFDVSLMQRLVSKLGDQVTRQLTVQYRMNEAIMNFSSDQFYHRSLIAHPSVAHHRLCDLSGMVASPLTESVIEFIDSAGAGWDEELEPDGESRRNIQEGKLILKLVEELLEAGVYPQDIAVIAPYSAQVRWLRQQIQRDGLEVDTVDGFQGREKEVVLISLVRSNDRSEIGFLADTRRMNVAMTRSRRKLVIVGDSATLGTHSFYASMVEYIEKVGGYRSVWTIDL